MAVYSLTSVLLVGGILLFITLFLCWRFIWFFRNPSRKPPAGSSIVSPADGTVVYVKQVEKDEDVVLVKKGLGAHIKDLIHEDLAFPKIVIGIFMSPFNVHYNRAPLSGHIERIRHYPARRNVCMLPMHLRTIFKKEPLYKDSLHILYNERTVTKLNGIFRGVPIPCYVVQIAGKRVNRIESYRHEGDFITRGAVFGLIRMGSQVDLVVRQVTGMHITVKPGDKVRAGETVLID